MKYFRLKYWNLNYWKSKFFGSAEAGVDLVTYTVALRSTIKTVQGVVAPVTVTAAIVVRVEGGLGVMVSISSTIGLRSLITPPTVGVGSAQSESYGVSCILKGTVGVSNSIAPTAGMVSTVTQTFGIESKAVR